MGSSDVVSPECGAGSNQAWPGAGRR